jgi:hypothetical protein
MAGDVLTPLVSPSGAFPPFAVAARRGGAVRKVVRWAFERQGLYAPAGRWPWDAPGLPPPVDVFVEDGRHGEYPYAARWHAGPPDLRVVSPLDAAGADSPPRHGAPSHVFVRVRSRGGGQSPVTATVQAFAAPASAGPPPWRLALDVPEAWVPLGASRTAVVPPGAFVDVGPFPWAPLTTGRHGLLACVDAPGDRCNALAPLLACAVGPTPLAQLVPFDNNIAYREVDVLP